VDDTELVDLHFKGWGSLLALGVVGWWAFTLVSALLAGTWWLGWMGAPWLIFLITAMLSVAISAFFTASERLSTGDMIAEVSALVPLHEEVEKDPDSRAARMRDTKPSHLACYAQYEVRLTYFTGVVGLFERGLKKTLMAWDVYRNYENYGKICHVTEKRRMELNTAAEVMYALQTSGLTEYAKVRTFAEVTAQRVATVLLPLYATMHEDVIKNTVSWCAARFTSAVPLGKTADGPSPF
jgi:hypothetical protein